MLETKVLKAIVRFFMRHREQARVRAVQIHQLEMALFILQQEFNRFREEKGFAAFDYISAIYSAVDYKNEPAEELIAWMEVWRQAQQAILKK